RYPCQTMSVCSGSGIVSDSTSASAESNRHSSTRVACSEKIAKLTPTPSQVAPSGYGAPGLTRIFEVGTEGVRYHVRVVERNDVSSQLPAASFQPCNSSARDRAGESEG